MNIRVLGEDSPEARLAAVCVRTAHRIRLLLGATPDYADFRDDLRKYVRLEILLARLEECRVPSNKRSDRLREILAQLAELQLEDL
jgi:hypothetical protein